MTTDEEIVKALCGHSTCKGQGTYSIRATCMNCDWAGRVEVTRGHEFSKYTKSCPKCSCDTLMRKSS